MTAKPLIRTHALALALLAASAIHHHAATFTVTNTNDSGGGSLRSAVIGANGSGQDDIIRIETTGVIKLTSGLLQVENSGKLTIIGPGPSLLTISGNDNSRVFYFRPEVTAAVSGVTVTGGNSK